MSGTIARVAELPPCDIHPDRKAKYDFPSRTRHGQWMYGCPECWQRFSYGTLGVGKGQMLVVKGPEDEAE